MKLNLLCVSYGFSNEAQIEETQIVGGLVDYIWKQSDDVLGQWALTCDAYDKEKRNIHLYGGLEDYISILNREQLTDIILKHAKTYSELNSYVKLNQLAETNGFSPEAEKQVEEPLMVGGLGDYIWRESDAVLREWALTCVRYEKEKENSTMVGGLVNYVRLLKKEELIEIILNYSKKYPELNSKINLNQLAHGYGISQPDEFPETKQVEEPVMVED